MLPVLIAALFAVPPVSPLLAAAVAQDPPGEPESTDDPLVRTVAVPIEDGRIDLVAVFTAILGDSTLEGDGDDGDGKGEGERAGATIRWNVEVSRALSFHLKFIEQATVDSVTFSRRDSDLLVRVDGRKLRRDEKELRTRVRKLFEQLFPERAADAAARYGIRGLAADGSRQKLAREHVAARTVLLAHGLDEPGSVWNDLIPELRDAGHVVCSFEYPNDQPIADSTELLGNELVRLSELGVREIDIVAHSMGGLVSRDLLTHPKWYAGDARSRKNAAGDPLPAIPRLITVGTPHRGSAWARFHLLAETRDQVLRKLAGSTSLLEGIFDGTGEALVDLLPESDFLRGLDRRPPPQGVAITTIAGRAKFPGSDALRRWIEDYDGNGKLASVLDGDGAVSLESARWKGVDGFVIVEGDHRGMLRDYLERGEETPPAIPVILERLSR